MSSVKTRVHVRSEDGLHEAVLVPGDTVPEWATVTNPAALDEVDEDTDTEPAQAETESVPAPAKRAPRRKATAPASE